MKPQQKQKLELTRTGNGDEPKLLPRILIEQPEYSYGDPSTGNMLCSPLFPALTQPGKTS
jgi:adenine-specific DNA-methyltransferase